MREVKFRAWNGSQMVEWDNLKSLRYAIENENIQVMQFTGLIDKNGVDIYEGDVYIVGTKDFKYTVVWHDTALRGKIEYESGCINYLSLEYWISHIEIIGNIYETKN